MGADDRTSAAEARRRLVPLEREGAPRTRRQRTAAPAASSATSALAACSSAAASARLPSATIAPAWPRAAAIWWNDAESFSLSTTSSSTDEKDASSSRGLVRIVTPPEDFVVCKPPAPSSLCAAAVFSSDFPRVRRRCAWRSFIAARLAALICERTSSRFAAPGSGESPPSSPLPPSRSAAPSFDDMTPRAK